MRIVFFGTPEFAVPSLRALLRERYDVVGVVTQPDRPQGRSRSTLVAPPVKAEAEGAGIPVHQPARPLGDLFLAAIRRLEPDLGVVVAYGHILRPVLLALPRLGMINVHASLLPRWRGAAPIQAAIASGDRETGITVMYMDEGLDTGDILLQRKIDILPKDTGETLHDRLAQVSPESLLESLDLLASGTAPRTVQDNALATYAPKLKREDGQIDWSEPADVIERKIRAFNPWPGAFTKIAMEPDARRNLKIFAAAVADLRGKPGEILRRDTELIVATGKGALSLGEVQLEGKRRMNATQFLRGASQFKAGRDFQA